MTRAQTLSSADIARLFDVPEESLHDPLYEAARQRAEAEREAYVAYLRACAMEWESRLAVKVKAEDRLGSDR